MTVTTPRSCSPSARQHHHPGRRLPAARRPHRRRGRRQRRGDVAERRRLRPAVLTFRNGEEVSSTCRCSPARSYTGIPAARPRPRPRPAEGLTMSNAPYTLVLLRHGESEWNAKNLFTGWVDVPLNDKGRTEAPRGGRADGRGRRAARRAAHLGAAPGDHHRAAGARRLRAALDPGAPLLAAQRAPLRRPAGQGQEGDAGGVRRGAVHALAPVLRHPAAEARRRRRVVAGRRRAVRRPARRDRAADRVPGRRHRPDAALLVRRASCPTCAPAARRASPRTATSLRALVKHLDGMSEEAVVGLNIPTGIPLVYTLDEDMRPTQRAASTSTPTPPRRPSRPWPTRGADPDPARAEQQTATGPCGFPRKATRPRQGPRTQAAEVAGLLLRLSRRTSETTGAMTGVSSR